MTLPFSFDRQMAPGSGDGSRQRRQLQSTLQQSSCIRQRSSNKGVDQRLSSWRMITLSIFFNFSCNPSCRDTNRVYCYRSTRSACREDSLLNIIYYLRLLYHKHQATIALQAHCFSAVRNGPGFIVIHILCYMALPISMIYFPVIQWVWTN